MKVGEFALYVLQRSGALLASNGVAGLAWRHRCG
jgi:hypothetical protein